MGTEIKEQLIMSLISKIKKKSFHHQKEYFFMHVFTQVNFIEILAGANVSIRMEDDLSENLNKPTYIKTWALQ